MTRRYLLRFALAAVCWPLAISSLTLAAESAEKTQPIREDIEWLDVWVPDNSVKDLPRVLLIGDSITKGYYSQVAEKLKGKATVSRLATSKSVGDPALLAEVALVLSQTHFDVIHFNNGMHGWGYSEQDYQTHFPELLETLKKGAPDAKLIWATTTAVREGDHFSKLAAQDRACERAQQDRGGVRLEAEYSHRRSVLADSRSS